MPSSRRLRYNRKLTRRKSTSRKRTTKRRARHAVVRRRQRQRSVGGRRGVRRGGTLLKFLAQKRGYFNKDWKTRLFVFNPEVNTLDYYYYYDDTRPRGQIIVNKLEIKDEGRGEINITDYRRDPERTFYLREVPSNVIDIFKERERERVERVREAEATISEVPTERGSTRIQKRNVEIKPPPFRGYDNGFWAEMKDGASSLREYWFTVTMVEIMVEILYENIPPTIQEDSISWQETNTNSWKPNKIKTYFVSENNNVQISFYGSEEKDSKEKDTDRILLNTVDNDELQIDELQIVEKHDNYIVLKLLKTDGEQILLKCERMFLTNLIELIRETRNKKLFSLSQEVMIIKKRIKRSLDFRKSVRARFLDYYEKLHTSFLEKKGSIRLEQKDYYKVIKDNFDIFYYFNEDGNPPTYIAEPKNISTYTIELKNGSSSTYTIKPTRTTSFHKDSNYNLKFTKGNYMDYLYLALGPTNPWWCDVGLDGTRFSWSAAPDHYKHYLYSKKIHTQMKEACDEFIKTFKKKISNQKVEATARAARAAKQAEQAEQAAAKARKLFAIAEAKKNTYTNIIYHDESNRRRINLRRLTDSNIRAMDKRNIHEPLAWRQQGYSDPMLHYLLGYEEEEEDNSKSLFGVNTDYMIP